MNTRILHTYDAQCDKCKGVCKHDVSKPQPTANVEPTTAGSHTPTPWVLEGNSINGKDFEGCIAMASGKSAHQNLINAAYIVRAVNSHDEMLGALKEAIENVAVYDTNPALVELFKSVIAKAEAK